MLSRSQAIKQVRKYHPEGGRVEGIVKKIYDTNWPNGTDRLMEFYLENIGLPYGAKNMNMESVVDCAEIHRIGQFALIGHDIGSWSDGQLTDKDGWDVADGYEDLKGMRAHDLAFYKTSSRKHSGHVAGVMDDKHIVQSGASEHGKKVGISDLYWGKGKYKIVKIRRFLTDAEYLSLIVGGKPISYVYALAKGDKGEEVKAWQRRLIAQGYDLGKWGADGSFGDQTDKATKQFQKDNGLTPHGAVNPMTLHIMGKIENPKEDSTEVRELKATVESLESMVKKEREKRATVEAKIAAAKKALA